MSEELDFYCHLYVDADLEEENLANELGKLFKTQAEGLFVDTDIGDLFVRKNDEFNEDNRKDELEGFLYYRCHVDIEPKTILGEDNAVSFVSKTLEFLWANGYAAAAACDYEDKLPYKGKSVPKRV